MEISEVLRLIDELVASLPDDQAESVYDRSASSFFNFLREYQCNIGQVVNLIKRATGMSPSQIRSCGDVSLLKDAIVQYESTEVLGRRVAAEELPRPGQWGYDNAAFIFGEREQPPEV